MVSRRKLVLAGGGSLAAAATYALFQAGHTLPKLDPAAEDRFRRLQNALLTSHAIPPESRFLELPSPPLRVHVLEAGRGQPVVLIHGGNSVAASWAPLLARLHARFRLYAPDRPGCGLTTKFNYRGVGLRAHAAAFVGAVLDALGLARCPLVGNSMGGYFALVFALARPERVTRPALVGEPAGSARTIRWSHRLIGTRVLNSLLYGTVLKPGPRSTRAAFERLLVADVRRVAPEYLECMAAGNMLPGALESWITMVERAFVLPGAGLVAGRSTLTHALRPELGALRTPTLFLWGEKDTFGPPAHGREMAALMPEARCEVIPDAGHLPWLDQPDLCGRLLASFLA